MEKTLLNSKKDASQNVIYENAGVPGKIEARYVKRDHAPYFIVYLSSQTGCAQGCRMCHLTATKQTKYAHVTPDQFYLQATNLLELHQKEVATIPVVHFNFMARGEPFANPWILNTGNSLLKNLHGIAQVRGLIPKSLISTIMPRELEHKSFAQIFPNQEDHPWIYYSLYSMNPVFRKKWLPKALPAEVGLEKLAAWQEITTRTPRIHYAFIEGENDSEKDVHEVITGIKQFGLKPDINIVRYNPYSDVFGKEPSEAVLKRNAHFFKSAFPLSEVKIIERVGFDVQASCGMFVEK